MPPTTTNRESGRSIRKKKSKLWGSAVMEPTKRAEQQPIDGIDGWINSVWRLLASIVFPVGSVRRYVRKVSSAIWL